MLLIITTWMEGSIRPSSTTAVNIVVLTLKALIKHSTMRSAQSYGTWPPGCCWVRGGGFSISVLDGVAWLRRELRCAG